MKCAHHDSDLLMLAHGELSGAKAFAIRAHLLICPSCRARYREFAAISERLAQGLTNPALGRRRWSPTSPIRWGTVFLALIAIGGLGLLFLSGRSSASVGAPVETTECNIREGVAVPKQFRTKAPQKANLSTSQSDR